MVLLFPHAYGIKCAWMKMSDNIWGGYTKFHDYYQSIGIYDNLPIIVNNFIPMLELENLIENYDNPVFPIDTNHIMDVCPF
jgi:hypothetical protein